MKLVDLNPSFVGTGGEGITDANGDPVPRREGIGLSLDCPCGDKACPKFFVAFENPLGGSKPTGKPWWKRNGNTFDTLTLRPSILRKSHCGWHGYITAGEVKSV